MANEVDYSPRKYTGNGSTTEFSFNWKIFTGSDITVRLEKISTGVQTTLTYGTDYGVTFGEVAGYITLTTAPTSEYYVIISRNVSDYQSKKYSTSTGFQGSEIENSFDKVSCNLQELDYTLQRSIKVAVGSSNLDMTLPAPSAGKTLKWNEEETGLINSTIDVDELESIATRLHASIDNIDTVAEDITNVNTVASAVDDVIVVSGSVSNVNTVGTDIENVNAVAGDLTNIDTVKADLTNIDTVAGISNDVTTVAGISGDVTAVKNIASNVTTVAGSVSNVNAVGADISNVNAVAGDLTNIDAVKNNATNINTVAGDKTNIDTVATNISKVNTVATNISHVSTVSTNISNVNTVAGDKTNIDTVAADKTNIDICASNISAINAAPTYAETATTQAGIATDKADACIAALVEADSLKNSLRLFNTINAGKLADTRSVYINAGALSDTRSDYLNGGTLSDWHIAGDDIKNILALPLLYKQAADTETELAAAELRIAQNESNIADIQGHLTTNDADIDSLEDRVTECEGDIDDLEGDMSDANTEINSAKSRITQNESDIAALQGLTDLFNIINSGKLSDTRSNYLNAGALSDTRSNYTNAGTLVNLTVSKDNLRAISLVPALRAEIESLKEQLVTALEFITNIKGGIDCGTIVK